MPGAHVIEKVIGVNPSSGHFIPDGWTVIKWESLFPDACFKDGPEYLLRGDATDRMVVDYIAGMTDQFALRLAEELK